MTFFKKSSTKKKEIEEKIEFLAQYTQNLEKRIKENYDFIERQLSISEKIINILEKIT